MKNLTKTDSPGLESISKAFLKLRTTDEITRFLKDLFSNKEIEFLSSRFAAAKLLFEGKSYVEIARLTGLSTATIAKVSEALKYGYDGFKTVFQRM